MATSKEQLQEDLPWDVERIPVGVDEHASDSATEFLEGIEDAHLSVKRVAAYARREGGEKRVATNDLLRALQHADGRLALVTWGTGGITSIGYDPHEQRYDVGGHSATEELMGNEPEFYETATRAKAKDMLAWSKPDVVLRSEADLLPDLDETEVTA